MLNPEGYEKIQNDWIKMYNEYEPQIDYEEVKKDAEAFTKRYNKE